MIGFRSGITPRRLLVAGLVLLAVALSAIFGRGPERPPIGVEPGRVEAREPGRAFGPSVGFTSRRSLDEHYEKHGAEFSGASKADYLRIAQSLRDARPGGPVLQVIRNDGVSTRFDRRDGTFVAFNRDGTIRTCFRPNDGERYFRRQADR
jgi:hypothetical protein